jgi:transposase
MKSRSRVSQHTQEFREKAVQLALSGDKNIAATARDLGLNISTLHTWINKYRDDVDIKPSTDLEARLIEQEKEIRRLKEERDILKKASAYFAANQK